MGKVIEHRRSRLGELQGPIAQALGISQSAYSRLESGQSAMSVTQLRIVALHLKTRPEDIVRDTERYGAQLAQQNVKVVLERQEDSSPGGLLIAIGLLTALLAAAK